MYLLDTNHCSLIILGDQILANKIKQVGNTAISTNIIVRGELIFMAEKSDYKAKNLARVISFLEDINLFTFDEETADIYGELKAQLINYFGPKDKQKRRKFTIRQLGISDNDLWIVATAVQYDLIVVSRDQDFQRIKQVKHFALESWID